MKTMPFSVRLAVVCAVLVVAPLQCHAKRPGVGVHALDELLAPGAIEAPAAGRLEVAFSPDEGAEALVIKVIDSAQRELRVLSYSFTSAAVTRAMLAALERGVDLKLVADAKNNVSEDRSGKARAALSALVNAGADVRVVSAFAIHHDKVIVADRRTVELGSFNYSDAAAHKNSENVLVNWDNPRLASVYLRHFERNYQRSTPFGERY